MVYLSCEKSYDHQTSIFDKFVTWRCFTFLNYPSHSGFCIFKVREWVLSSNLVLKSLWRACEEHSIIQRERSEDIFIYFFVIVSGCEIPTTILFLTKPVSSRRSSGSWTESGLKVLKICKFEIPRCSFAIWNKFIVSCFWVWLKVYFFLRLA